MGAPDLCDYFFVNGWTAERAPGRRQVIGGEMLETE
jgi:hypothetical protein